MILTPTDTTKARFTALRQRTLDEATRWATANVSHPDALHGRACINKAIRRNKKFQPDGWQEAHEILLTARREINRRIRTK